LCGNEEIAPVFGCGDEVVSRVGGVGSGRFAENQIGSEVGSNGGGATASGEAFVLRDVGGGGGA